MSPVCSSCGSPLLKPSLVPHDLSGHGLCESCLAGLGMQPPEELEAWLDRFEMPVLLMDYDCGVLGGNRRALDKLELNREQMTGRLAGNVLDCVHASEPGGCGNTIHCKACAIRRTVTYTHHTGKPRDGVPASLFVLTHDDPNKISFLISTRKTGDTVLVYIDEHRPLHPA